MYFSKIIFIFMRVHFPLLFALLWICLFHSSCRHDKHEQLSYESQIDSLNAQVLTSQKPLNEQIKMIHALISRSDSMGYVKGEIEACLNGYRLYFRENIYPETSQMLRQAEEKLARYDDLLVSARVYFYNGQFQARINNNDVALNYYLLSAEKCRELQDTKRLTRTYREIGIMMLENGNLTLARKYLWQAYSINLKAKNPSDLSGDMNSLGVFYMRLGKPDRLML